MTITRRRLVATATAVLCVSVLALAGLRAADSLPSQLSDQEFWKLSSDFSEPDGFFRSDNLLSNEVWMQRVIPDLLSNIKTPSVYMGVGPEQNFTYITNLRPKMVFIVDVRRGNFDLQLTYKALFELSADRAEFVSRLFSRKRPDGLDKSSSVLDIFNAYKDVASSETLFKENLKAIDDLLVNKHHFTLSDGDLQGVEYVYHAFYNFGPGINYSSTGGFGARYQPSYADLMVATDEAGAQRSFLANEDNFAFLKGLETKNLLVPVVGNFAGPKAIRAVGDWIRTKGATVSAFYLSNVEQYLYQDRIWGNFCRNVATLPLEATSSFIRSVRSGGGNGPGMGLNSELGNMKADVKDCGTSGQ
jgi:hypothetical protein